MTKKTTEKIGPLTIRAEVANGQCTGNWVVDIPANFNGNTSRQRKRHRTKTAAITAARQLVKAVQVGQMLLNSGHSGLGLHDVFDQWLQEQKARVRSGLKKVSSLGTDLNGLRHVMDFFKNEDMGKIDASRIEEFQMHRLAIGQKRVSVNTECQKLKALLNWAHNKRLIPSVPTVRKLDEPPVNTEVPQQDEMLLILAELPFSQALLTRLMVETGLRPSEAYTLRWDSVDLTRNTLKVGNVDENTPKTMHSYRDVAFGEGLAMDLAKQRKSTNSEWVFPNRDFEDKPMDNYRRSLKSAVERSGVKRYGKPIKFTPKYCRKAYTSYQYLRGIPLSTIKQLVGHSPSSKVTETHYLHIPESTRRSAVLELDEAGTSK